MTLQGVFELRTGWIPIRDIVSFIYSQWFSLQTKYFKYLNMSLADQEVRPEVHGRILTLRKQVETDRPFVCAHQTLAHAPHGSGESGYVGLCMWSRLCLGLWLHWLDPDLAYV